MTTELQTGTKKTKLAAAKKTADIISSRPLKMHGKKNTTMIISENYLL